MMKEVFELVEAVRLERADHVCREALDVAAMALRTIDDLGL